MYTEGKDGQQSMNKKQKNTLMRIIVSGILFAVLMVLQGTGAMSGWNRALVLLLFMVPYLIIGYDVIRKAAINISHGQVFDENFLMMIATFGAVGVGEYEEAVAVMLFYQVGELFQSYAVGKSRQSISDLMDICPEYANIEEDGELVQVDPDDVEVGTIIVIKPGEKIPLDGVVVEGSSMVDTAALTGESVPRRASVGDDVISGCVNGSETLKVRTTKEFDDSTVSRILELVENASSKKARLENFITRFARYYTPIVTISAVVLAVVPPLFFGGAWTDWIARACTFLVISCPCALVISVPLGFFGGIGAASQIGVLVKGSNYLEAVGEVSTVVFDKTGTLTKGEFRVSKVSPSGGMSGAELLELAALGEGYSNHPIAASIREAYHDADKTTTSSAAGPGSGRASLERVTFSEEIAGQGIHADGMPMAGKASLERVTFSEEIAGQGIHAVVDGKDVYLGNAKLMCAHGISFDENPAMGTIVYIAADGRYAGSIVISDGIKDGAKEAIRNMKSVGVKKCVMLTGDRKETAQAVAAGLGIDEVHSELLPADKVGRVEGLLKELEGTKDKLAFVGDGINDAPVLSRADVGIAMGSMGSDAAIEAADIVIMDDDIRKIASIVRISRRTLVIVKQNIVFALGVKFLVLILGALGIANMWAAVFADVGVAVLAILNSMRTLRMGHI